MAFSLEESILLITHLLKITHADEQNNFKRFQKTLHFFFIDTFIGNRNNDIIIDRIDFFVTLIAMQLAR